MTRTSSTMFEMKGPRKEETENSLSPLFVIAKEQCPLWTFGGEGTCITDGRTPKSTGNCIIPFERKILLHSSVNKIIHLWRLKINSKQHVFVVFFSGCWTNVTRNIFVNTNTENKWKPTDFFLHYIYCKF